MISGLTCVDKINNSYRYTVRLSNDLPLSMWDMGAILQNSNITRETIILHAVFLKFM